MAALERLQAGRTTFIIAHRLSTVRARRPDRGAQRRPDRRAGDARRAGGTRTGAFAAMYGAAVPPAGGSACPSRKRLVVLHLAGRYPLGGIGVAGDPLRARARQRSATTSTTSRTRGRRPTTRGSRAWWRTRATAWRFLADVMRALRPRRPLGLRGRARPASATGSAGQRLRDLYREADGIVNVCGATELTRRAPPVRGARLRRDRSGLRADPGRQGRSPGDRGSLEEHDVHFTYGENLGQPDCPVPLEKFAWHTTRPPVIPDLWDATVEPRRRAVHDRRHLEERGQGHPVPAARPTTGPST